MTNIRADPAAPLFHRFRSESGPHLLVVPFSRLYDLPDDAPDDLDGEFGDRIAVLAKPATGEAPLERVPEPNPQNLSLNVSSSCNLSCTYCYASRGSFGGAQPQPMSWMTAKGAIDQLLSQAEPTRPITIGFLGGEPFANRPLLHRCVAYAAEQGARLALDVRFSVTTNGTLLRESDLEVLRRHPFAVTVSLDGGTQVQDTQRPGRRGAGSFEAVVGAIDGLLRSPGLARVSARATVTRSDMDLPGRLAAIAALGFSEIGFSPLRAGVADADALKDKDWGVYLEAMLEAARGEIQRARQGLPVRLGNLLTAMRQIHVGASSPYPCGAGGGYFSVAADGRWYACHRAIGNEAFALGDNSGLNLEKRLQFISERHVHSQVDCRNCWARYLCSGGCHQEAPSRTASSCDFIRAWLDFCLQVYCDFGQILLFPRPRAASQGEGVL